MDLRCVILTVVLASTVIPTVVGACETSACRRWFGLELVRDDIPRDAAVVLEGSVHAEICGDEFTERASVVVRRGDVVVPGSFEAPVSLPHELVWYPDGLLEPGDYTLSVEINNTAIEALLGVTADAMDPCGPDVYSDVIPFSVADTLSPPAPAVVAPPSFGIVPRELSGSFDSLACCPGVVPREGFAGDCEEAIGTSGYAGDCIYFYDFNYLTIETESFAYADGHDALWLYQLVVDGEMVDRGLRGTGARRNERVCAHVEAIHLGTGEVVGSEVACAPEALAVGPTAHMPFFELSCDQALACGTADGWDPEHCTPYVIGEPPAPPSAPLAEVGLSERCEAIAPATTPEYPEPEAQGCGCTQTRASELWLMLAGLLVRRRRATH